MKLSHAAIIAAAAGTAIAAPAVTVTQHVHKQETAYVEGIVGVQDGSTYTSYVTSLAYATSASVDPVPSGSGSASGSVVTVTATYGSAQPSSSASPGSSASSSASILLQQVEDIASVASPSASSTPLTTLSPSTSLAAESTSAPATTSTPSTTATPFSSPTPSSTASSSSPSSSSPSSDFQNSILNEHNSKRALHKDTPSLSWSDTLASYAQNYADNYDCSGTLTHSGGPYGENLALGYSATGTVDAWYGEISSYDWSNPGFSSSTGHFTQVVWKSTTQVGCGIKSCNNEWGNYVVCSYQSAGNFIGEFPQNVEPLA